MSRVLQAIRSHRWGITEPALRTIIEVAERVGPGREAIEREEGRELRNEFETRVRDGVAIIPVHGPLFRYANLFTYLSGASSMELIALEFSKAMEDPAVKAVVLDVDSPGGMVNGTQELAQLIYEARGRKPIVSFVSGMGASAAYWIASAADVVVAGRTAELGSVGAVIEVVDYSKADEMEGIRSFEFVSSVSPKKRLPPDTDAGAAELQQLVDDLGEVFVATVAEHRGVTREDVLARYGQGGLFVGQRAVDQGLADGISTLEAVIQATASLSPGSPGLRAAIAGGDAHPPSEDVMSDTTKAADAPTPAAPTSIADLDEAYGEQLAEVRRTAADAERARILGIADLPGDAALRRRCQEDPGCSTGDAAQQLLARQTASAQARAEAELTRRAEAEEELEAPGPSAGTPASDDEVAVQRIISAARSAGISTKNSTTVREVS